MNFTSRPDAERRITGRVVAHPLTGQPEPWVEIERFECDAGEFRAEMRAVADTWSTRRAGDVLAFRVTPRVEGAGSHYWYLSPAKGPTPVPPAGRDASWTSSASRVSDWLSAWTVENYPLSLWEHLAKLDDVLALTRLREAFQRAARALAENPLVRASRERDGGVVRWLTDGGRSPRAATLGRASDAVSLLGAVATEFEEYDGTDGGEYEWRLQSPGAFAWRRNLARNVLDAITKSGAMLAEGVLDAPTDWRTPPWNEARYAARRDVCAWLRERVSLDRIAALLGEGAEREADARPSRVGRRRKAPAAGVAAYDRSASVGKFY